MCAGAERGVVRAVSDSSVTVTIRHHVGGFPSGGGSAYEKRLAVLNQIMTPIGGHAEVWSEEGRGVRVTLVAPAATELGGQSEGYEPAQGLPDSLVRNRGAGNDNGAVNDGDVNGRTIRRIVRRSQHQIHRISATVDRHTGTDRQSFEPGMQQRSAGDDANGRRGTPLFKDGSFSIVCLGQK